MCFHAFWRNTSAPVSDRIEWVFDSEKNSHEKSVVCHTYALVAQYRQKPTKVD